jgi:hypothetical protein
MTEEKEVQQGDNFLNIAQEQRVEEEDTGRYP